MNAEKSKYVHRIPFSFFGSCAACMNNTQIVRKFYRALWKITLEFIASYSVFMRISPYFLNFSFYSVHFIDKFYACSKVILITWGWGFFCKNCTQYTDLALPPSYFLSTQAIKPSLRLAESGLFFKYYGGALCAQTHLSLFVINKWHYEEHEMLAM